MSEALLLCVAALFGYAVGEVVRWCSGTEEDCLESESSRSSVMQAIGVFAKTHYELADAETAS